MFKNKFKTKPSLKSVSNAIKTVGQKDLSEDTNPRAFILDDLTRYGVGGLIVGMAFDPVQSLMAFSTTNNEIRVYGQRQVEVVFELNTVTPIVTLKFVKGVYLVAVDAKSTILIFSLHSKKMLSSYAAPGKITAVETDPSLDWLIIGLQNGTIYFYDIDRAGLAPLRIENLQRRVLPKQRTSPVLSIKWDPRHIGTLLITYSDCAVIYSIVTNEIKQSFIYELPPGSKGAEYIGDRNSSLHPEFTNSIWHPNGLHIMSTHIDNSIVFWDVNDGTLIQARTLSECNINKRSRSGSSFTGFTPIIKATWLTEKNPENTQLLFAGGDGDAAGGIHTLTMLDFGTTLPYSVTSHDKSSQFYSNPRQQKVLSVPSKSSIIDFLPLPESNPYFSGGHNPTQVIILLESGEVQLIDYPSGKLNYDATKLPSNISFIHPTTTCLGASTVRRIQLMGMLAATKPRPLLKGGLATKRPQRVFDAKTLIITGHNNGSIRMWDSSNTELDENAVLQTDISVILGNESDCAITHVSFSGETVELAASTIEGKVVLLKYGTNQHYNSNGLVQMMKRLSLKDKQSLLSLTNRTPNFKEGFLPIVCLNVSCGRVTALENSDIGFVAACYENGQIVVVDRRGPAIIFNENLSAFSNLSGYITAVKFGIMELDSEGYSSIIMFAGSDRGELLAFKIVPNSEGRFASEFYDSTQANDDKITNIIPINIDSGAAAIAKIDDMRQLGSGILIRGAVITSSSKDIRVIKPMRSKVSHKGFSNPSLILSIGLNGAPKRTSQSGYAIVLTALLSNGEIKILSVPELREITYLKVPYPIDPSYAKSSSVLPSGDIVIRLNKNESSLVSVLGKGITLNSFATDTLFNENIYIPYRPQVAALQWARGTKMISTDDLNHLIGGPNRPKPRTLESELAFNISPEAGNSSNKVQPLQTAGEDFSYKKPVRGAHSSANLGNPVKNVMRSVQDGIDSMEETANSYAKAMTDSVNESVSDTKNSLIKSAFKSKFGF